jgi:hypothetical protein
MVMLTFASGSLDCRCTFCAESKTAKFRYLIAPKRWGGFELWYNCTPGIGHRFWPCPAGQAVFAAHLAMPFWFLVALLAPYPGLSFVRWLRRRRRAKRGQCLECGYNLMANVSGACPECGTETSR